MLHWVSLRCQLDLTITALAVPEVEQSNRRACQSFRKFLAAAQRRDAKGAGEHWARSLDAVSPFFDSPLGDRLIVDLFD
jgi:hypothetical protein